MNHSWIVAKRELRSYFHSLSAYFFIAIFVSAAVWCFFVAEKFVGTGRAEVRGFFNWVPALLVVLVPGLTMRQWARENEMGSIELLMTLPAHNGDVVLGKFLGSLGVVIIGLLFTLGIPITAASLGTLDWGPVFGGYLGAVFVAAAYTAIGLFVSSWFSDQFLALIVSLVVCGVFGGMGHESVLNWVATSPIDQFLGGSLSSTLRFVGFWPRFANIGRGMLDLRDVLYYGTITGLFLYLNVCRLRFRRWA